MRAGGLRWPGAVSDSPNEQRSLLTGVTFLRIVVRIVLKQRFNASPSGDMLATTDLSAGVSFAEGAWRTHARDVTVLLVDLSCTRLVDAVS